MKEKNIKPKEIRYMPKHQWNMLRSGLNSDGKRRKTSRSKRKMIWQKRWHVESVNALQ